MRKPIVINCNFVPLSDKKLFGIMLVGAYVLCLGTLAFVEIPKGNSEYFGQLMIGLVGAIGVIVGAVWKTSQVEDKTTTTLQTLVDKVNPATGEAKDGPGNPTSGAGIGFAPSPATAEAASPTLDDDYNPWPIEPASGLGQEGEPDLQGQGVVDRGGADPASRR